MSASSRELLVLGAAGGNVLAAAATAEEAGWRIRALVNNLAPEAVHLDDCPYPIYQLNDLPEELRRLPAFCCLTTPEYRRQFIREAQACGMRHFATVVHPLAHIQRPVSLGEGSRVGALVNVVYRVSIGRHVLLAPSVVVGHDTQIEDFVTAAQGANIGSACWVQEGAFVGMGSVVLPRVTIGRNAVVAAGAVVTEAVPPHTLVAGLPATVKKEGIPGYRGG